MGIEPGVERLAARLFYPCKGSLASWLTPVTWLPHFNYAREFSQAFRGKVQIQREPVDDASTDPLQCHLQVAMSVSYLRRDCVRAPRRYRVLVRHEAHPRPEPRPDPRPSSGQLVLPPSAPSAQTRRAPVPCLKHIKVLRRTTFNAADYLFRFVQKRTIKHHAAQALMTGLCFGLGASRPLPVHYQAEVEPGSRQFPIVVFSHGCVWVRVGGLGKGLPLQHPRPFQVLLV